MFAINWSTLGSIGATAVGGITAAGLAIVSGGMFSGHSIVHQQRELDIPLTDEDTPA